MSGFSMTYLPDLEYMLPHTPSGLKGLWSLRGDSFVRGKHADTESCSNLADASQLVNGGTGLRGAGNTQLSRSALSYFLAFSLVMAKAFVYFHGQQSAVAFHTAVQQDSWF